MKEYTVAILGATGAVGQEMRKRLEERNFPVGRLKLLASTRSAGKTVMFRGQNIPIEEANEAAFQGVDLVLGAADNVHLIPLQAYLQETVPAEQMGRAFSVLTLISSAAMPVGLLVSSPLAEQVGVAFWFLLSGLAMLAGTAAILALRRPAPAPEEEGQR